MKKLLFLFSVILVAFALTACAGSSGTPEKPGNPGGQSVETPVQTPTDNEQPQISSDTRIVTDVRGDVEIPARPQRIVDLSGNSDILALLGFSVVGTANSDAYDYTKFPSYLEDVLAGAEILGYSYQDTMDIENVINAAPDLIIISTIQEKMYDALSSIAPTLMIQLEALDWREDIKSVARILDKEDEALQWLTNYEAMASQTGASIREQRGDDTSYLSFLASGGQFYIFSGAGFGNVLYEDLGLAVPEGMPEQENVSLPVVTYEGLAAIDADVVFVIATEADWAELENNSIWKGLPAVAAGNVVVLPSSPYFNQGYSPIGKLILLEELPVMLNEMQNR